MPMPRRRAINKELEPNLYFADRARKYLYYRNPNTGKKFPLTGMPIAQANDYARQANAILDQFDNKDQIPVFSASH